MKKTIDWYIEKFSSSFFNKKNYGKRIGLIKYSGHEAYLSRTTGQDFGIVRTTGSTITDGANLISVQYVQLQMSVDYLYITQ